MLLIWGLGDIIKYYLSMLDRTGALDRRTVVVVIL